MNKLKFCILGNTNNPKTKKPNDPYSWFVKTFWDGLLRNDYEVVLIDYRSTPPNKLKTLLITHKFDFVFTHLTFHPVYPIPKMLNLFNEINKKVGSKFIHICGDARKKDRYMKDISNSFYMAFVNNHILKTNVKNKWKIPVHYLPYASLTYDNMGKYDKSLDFKMPVFTGSWNSHQDRKKFIQKIQDIMKIKIVSTQSSGDLRNKTQDLSMSSTILGLCTGYDLDGYIDVRPFQYLGAGAIMIMRKFKGMDELIPEDLYFSFDTYNNAEIVKDYWKRIEMTSDNILNNKREKIFNYMQQNHSSKIRITQVIDLLKQG